jgi:hypothetical protein
MPLYWLRIDSPTSVVAHGSRQKQGAAPYVKMAFCTVPESTNALSDMMQEIIGNRTCMVQWKLSTVSLKGCCVEIGKSHQHDC